MADGAFRFHQGAGQYYFPQENPQQVHHSNRATVLRNGTRSPNLSDAFHHHENNSPINSPQLQSPPQNPFHMYSQGHQQGQNMFVNGGHGQGRYGMQMKQFQPNQHPQAHNQQNKQQDQASQSQANNLAAHQHNASTSGFSGGTANFNPGQLRNGTPGSMQNGMGRPSNDHWTLQLSLSQQSREATGPHSHARHHPGNRTLAPGMIDPSKRDTDKEEKNRGRANVEPTELGWNELDLGGQGLRALSTPLFNYAFVKKLYINGNKLTYLPPALGRLRQLTHLDASQNDITDLPAEIGMLVYLTRLLLFDNHLESLPYELGSLYHLEVLGIEGNPLNPEMRSIVMQEGTQALIRTLQDNSEIPDPPAERDWIILDEPKATAAGPPETFSVLSYNTLCDKYATQQQFGYTPMSALSWDHRKEVILQELRARDGDIMCLQEIDTDNFQEYFRPALAHNGYKGIFWPKTRARTMAEKEAKAVDGCAIFFKNNKYILLDKTCIDFANLAINRPDMKGEHEIFNRVMPRDNVAVVCFLENRQTGTRMIVVNTHFHWDPQYRDVKVVQAAILTEEIARLADNYAKFPPCKDKDKVLYRFSDGDAPSDTPDSKPTPEPLPEPGPSQEYASGLQIPLVLCGDFNSETHSGVYELLATGSLPRDHSDLGSYNYGNFTRDGMTHPFGLRSAYGNINELRFTNYTPGFTGVIDYIWYTPAALQVTALLGEVDRAYLQRVPGFPNYHFPSDHLALLSEFVVKPRKESRKVVEADFGGGEKSAGGSGRGSSAATPAPRER